MNSNKAHSRIPLLLKIIPLLLLILSCQRARENKYSVIKGEFIQSVTETGELEAINAESVMMPNINYRYGYSFKITGLVEHGTMVEKGDSVAALDPSSIYKYIIQQNEALENARGRAEKQEVQAEIRRRDLEVQLMNEESAYDLKKLELERMQFESDMKKKVKELEFKKAGLKLEKVRKQLALYPLLEKYDKLISDLRIKQLQADIQNAADVLPDLVLHSPGNGYFQVQRNRRNDKNFQLGDEVNMGSMIASIPDVSHMKVKSYVYETDISKMKTGMMVNIRLDALPDISFEGVVEDIARMCTGKDGQMIFTTEIRVLENDPRLKPGMSVSCEYISYESENELYVPNECILSEAGKTYLFVKKGSKFKKTEVETGRSNAAYTLIKTKLKPGRELLSPEMQNDL